MEKRITNERFGMPSIPPVEDPKRPFEPPIPDGTLFGGEELEKGTLHGGEELDPGTLHGGEELEKGTLHGGEELAPGTLHQKENRGDRPLLPFTLKAEYSPATYRTKDGKGFFKFQYMDRGSYLDIDILEEPSQSRNKQDYICHRLPSRTAGRKKICFAAGKSPTTITQARTYSIQWSELVQTYLNTGKTPDQQLEEKGDKKKGLWSWLN